MSDVDLSPYIAYGERFSVLGYVPPEREDNRDLASDQQRPPDTTVYTTNDPQEAERLRRSGGFMTPDARWVVVTGYRDTQVQEGGQMVKQTTGARKKPPAPQEF
jgi:hypothetical protein